MAVLLPDRFSRAQPVIEPRAQLINDLLRATPTRGTQESRLERVTRGNFSTHAQAQRFRKRVVVVAMTRKFRIAITIPRLRTECPTDRSRSAERQNQFAH